MKYKIKFMLLIFATSTVFFSACNKTELVETTQYDTEDVAGTTDKSTSLEMSAELKMPELKVSNGMLIFSDEKEYSDSRYVLSNLSDDALGVGE